VSKSDCIETETCGRCASFSASAPGSHRLLTRERLRTDKERAAGELDPTLKAQRVAEAGAPTEYLRDVHEAHCLFYGSNAALKLRVHVVVEALPVRTCARLARRVLRRPPPLRCAWVICVRGRLPRLKVSCSLS
jgi:hypothetical protein